MAVILKPLLRRLKNKTFKLKLRFFFVIKNQLLYYEKALNVRLSIYGEQHPDVASSYENLFEIYTKLGDTAKAEECRLKAEEIRAKLQ